MAKHRAERKCGLSRDFRLNNLSVVVPVYRSEYTLEKLCASLQETLPLEIIFVEDCGGDESWKIIKHLCAKFDNVRGFKLSRNVGQHNALLCGIRHARGEIIVTIDDDLQNPPDQIAALLSKIEEGYDVVYGFPQRETHGFLRGVASRCTKYLLDKAIGASTASRASAFRAFRSHVVGAFSEFNDPYANIDVLLTWGTTNFAAIPVKQNKREHGASGYTLRKLIKHCINMVTGYSVLPLKVASALGLVFGATGFLLLVYVCAIFFLHGQQVPGFTFIAALISIFSGAQLLCLGVMGEYLSRIYHRSMGRPSFYVSEYGGSNGISGRE